MFRQGAKWMLVVMLTISLGCHWAILQSAAWVGMMVKYSEAGSLKEAVAKTFDGKHPCKLCKMVREGKQAEQKSDAQLDLKKMDFFADSVMEFSFPQSRAQVLSPHITFSSRLESPPVPVPLSV